MKKRYIYPLALATLVLTGCNTKEANEAPVESSSTSFVSSSSTQESSSSSTSYIEESSSMQISSAAQESNSTEKYYQLVIDDFKSKLLGEWTYSNSLAEGMTFYHEISEISFREDGTFSLKMSSDKNGTNGVVLESNGTYQISENGVKQTLEGFPHYVDNYDDYAKQDAGFAANYIQIRFTNPENVVTTGIYIYPNGHLTFENPHLLFNENVTGLSQFEKF